MPELWLNLAVKFSVLVALLSVLLLDSQGTVQAQRNVRELQPAPMRRPPPDPDDPRWHTVQVTPRANLPDIRFYDKLNPVWWLGNADEPAPPDSYLPDDPHRKTKWYFRNPFHNLTFYVIGVADKNFSRSGRFPHRNSDPRGGWDFAISRKYIFLLPYVSYDRDWCNFYLGWRERGNFGVKLNFPGKKSKPQPVEDHLTSDLYDR